MVTGRAMSDLIRSISAVASLSDLPPATLKEMVTAGSCPCWLTDSGPAVRSTVAKAPSGTRSPLEERT